MGPEGKVVIRRFRRIWLASMFTVAIASCSRSEVPLARVSGVVTYQGKPVATARMLFTPESKNGDRYWPASAVTSSDGRYELQSIGAGRGAVVGKHVVTIVKRGPSPGPIPGGPAVGNETRPEFQAYMQPGPPLIPEKYFSPTTSKLIVDVKKGSNPINFTLED